MIITFLLSLAPFQNKHLIARLFAYVPVEVKIISLGAHPAAAANSSLAASKSFLTERPAECSDEAFPNFLTCFVNAERELSTIGVVAA